jgi:putative redox protein
MTETKAGGTPALAEAVAKIRAHLGTLGDRAKATFRTKTRLEQGLTTTAKIRHFDLTIDEPAELGGADAGPNPVEVLLAAFGTCQEIVFAVYAAALGIEIDRLEIDVDGDLDPRGFFGVADVPAGLSQLRFRVRIESTAPAERIAELVRLAELHCPVLDVIRRPVPISGGVTLNGAPLETGAG